jgi:hypothetical protein
MADDVVIVPPLEHAGFRVSWGGEQVGFEMRSVSGGRLLSTTGPLWTAEHVVSELTAWGFWAGSADAIEALIVADEVVAVRAGDPFVVGHPATGAVGIASSDGRRVELLPGPDGGFRWRDGTAEQLVSTVEAVLRASAPMTFAGAESRGCRDAMWAHGDGLIARMAWGRPELGLNVRGIQQWALAATDVTEPMPSMLVNELLVGLDLVEDAPLRRAVRVLRGRQPPVRRPGLGPAARRRHRR